MINDLLGNCESENRIYYYHFLSLYIINLSKYFTLSFIYRIDLLQQLL
jgi:hypothetical protein